jgi:hypothetical protein
MHRGVERCVCDVFELQHVECLVIVSIVAVNRCVTVDAYPDRSYYGGPMHECPYCGAVFWFQEHVKSASVVTQQKIVYNLCCKGGKINLKPYKKPPKVLAELLRFDGDAQSKRFLRQIRSCNSLFTFTSLGANI